MTTNDDVLYYVPLAALNDYLNHEYWYKVGDFIVSRVHGRTKKPNYKKAAKYLNKAMDYLPANIMVEVRRRSKNV
jgi:hypothetical protein